MLMSKKWISQYMDISDITMEEIADRITCAGFEVENIEYGSKATNLIIGEILDCIPHPNSDHLHVCKVNTGDKIRKIVCGAPNVRKGLKVIVALPGAKLPGGEIKNSTIRGVDSDGMICSLGELGVDSKSLTDYQKAGIEELPDDALVGNTDVLAYLGLDDIVLDISLTPNRADCMAAFAMAKEIGAILNKKVTLPDFNGVADQGSPTKLIVESKTDKCPLYLGKIIRSVTIKESPQWMKELLHSANIKSINNVVDISNLVMLETGQPLHFFDLGKLEKEEIVVRDDLNIDYVALDGNSYAIQPGDIMITVNDKPKAIGGIMGGDDSKIDDDTKGILIEAASFNLASIRNSARKFNLNTDSAARNSKGIEPGAPYAAMDRAVQLLIEYADASGIEATAATSEKNVSEVEFDVSLDNINQLLGTDFSEAQVLDVLYRLDLNPSLQDESIHVVIPSYRQDLRIEADIAEEVIRIIGFDDLASTMPLIPATAGRLTPRQQMRRKVREILVNQGYYEAITYTLISKNLLDDAIMPFDSAVELMSPMSEDRRYVRGSILPSLLESVAYNHARSLKNIALFEIGNVYSDTSNEERLAIALSGNLQECRWDRFAIKNDFYMMKGLIQSMLLQFGFASSRIRWEKNELDDVHFHPYQSACVYLGKDLLGIVGKIHPSMAKKYEVSDDTTMCELKLEVMMKSKTGKIKFEPISKYPSVTRDIAFMVENSVTAEDIMKSIKKRHKAIVQDVEIFDIYRGQGVLPGHKSIAVKITFQSMDHTLKDEEVNEAYDEIVHSLLRDVDAKLRV